MIPVNILDHGSYSITVAAENPLPLVVRARSGHALAPAPFHVARRAYAHPIPLASALCLVALN
jgi:hypothetical protein